MFNLECFVNVLAVLCVLSAEELAARGKVKAVCPVVCG